MPLATRLLNTPNSATKFSSSTLPSSSASHYLSSHFALPSLLRFPLNIKHSSSLFRVFSSSQPATTSTSTMGDAPDAGMDDVQRRLMFEDESVPSHLLFCIVSAVYVLCGFPGFRKKVLITRIWLFIWTLLFPCVSHVSLCVTVLV